MMNLKRILLAEDDPRDVELALEGLGATHLANEVEVVYDGEQALDYLYRRGAYAGRPEGNPALILLDMKMPLVSGLEVLQEIHANPDLNQIPVVMLTSSKEDQDLDQAYALGCNAYVVKPVNFKDFIAAVKSLGMFWAVLNEPPRGCLPK